MGFQTSARIVESVHFKKRAFLGSGVPNNEFSGIGAIQVKTQEDQPAKVSDGFGQKVNDEEFVKVISSVW